MEFHFIMNSASSLCCQPPSQPGVHSSWLTLKLAKQRFKISRFLFVTSCYMAVKCNSATTKMLNIEVNITFKKKKKLYLHQLTSANQNTGALGIS